MYRIIFTRIVFASCIKYATKNDKWRFLLVDHYLFTLTGNNLQLASGGSLKLIYKIRIFGKFSG